MTPLVAFILGAAAGVLVAWGVTAFVWYGKVIEANKARDDAQKEINALKWMEKETERLMKENTDLQSELHESDTSLEQLQNQYEVLLNEKAHLSSLEADLVRLRSERAELEGQVSRLQLEKAQAVSDAERFKFQLQALQKEKE